jgi:endonuclease/exonuclease/phosphatase (EEP) superfamily protein YafD
MTEHNFIQLINSATHRDGGIIDHIYIRGLHRDGGIIDHIYIRGLHRDRGIIDHIYIRGLHSVQSGVLPVYYSDHAAIYSILQ